MERKQKFRVVLYIIIAAVIAAAVIFAAARGGMDSTSVLNEKLELGQKYLVELDYSNAVLEFTDAIKIDPKNPDAYIGLAEAYIGTGDTEKAIEALEMGYEETGDERIKKMLDELTGDSETEEVTLPAETTTEAETTVTTEENNGEASDDDVIPMESIYIPYKVNGSLMDEKYEEGKIKVSIGTDFDNIFYCDYNNSIDMYIQALDDNSFYITRITAPKSESFDDHHGRYGHIIDIKKAGFPTMESKYAINSPYLLGMYRVFDENNTLICENTIQNDYIYDENGRLVQYGNTKYEYNKNGNLKEYNYWFNIDECKYTYKKNYKYDENDRLIKYTWLDNRDYGYDTTTYKDTITYEYDDRGNCIYEEYDSDSCNHIHKYDSYGNEIYYKYTWKPPHGTGNQITTSSYKYDNKGNAIEIEQKYESEGDSYKDSAIKKQTRKYDSNNNVTYVKTTVHETSESDYDDEYRIKVNDYTIEYINEYDSDNNLIRKKSSIIYSNGEHDDDIYTEVYTYDSDGRVKTSEIYNADNECIATNEYEYLRLELPKYILDEFREAAGSRK